MVGEIVMRRLKNENLVAMDNNLDRGPRLH
jgi:hypothetical protein